MITTRDKAAMKEIEMDVLEGLSEVTQAYAHDYNINYKLASISAARGAAVFMTTIIQALLGKEQGVASISEVINSALQASDVYIKVATKLNEDDKLKS